MSKIYGMSENDGRIALNYRSSGNGGGVYKRGETRMKTFRFKIIFCEGFTSLRTYCLGKTHTICAGIF